MRADPRRLRRLQRLEQVRALAQRSAALDAAQAESTLAQLEQLAARTRIMASAYRQRQTAQSGHELRQTGQFLAGLQGIHTATTGDAQRARDVADRKQHELALAERRRAVVEERIGCEARALAAQRETVPLGARRAVGTELE